MKDRYLFRAKTVHSQRWLWGNYSCKNYEDNSSHYIGEQLSGILIDPETVGQCTGCKDKTGDLIYEGDIVYISCYKNSYPHAVVVYDTECARWCLDFIDTNVFTDFAQKLQEDMKIIGNIHDNSELLAK